MDRDSFRFTRGPGLLAVLAWCLTRLLARIFSIGGSYPLTPCRAQQIAPTYTRALWHSPAPCMCRVRSPRQGTPAAAGPHLDRAPPGRVNDAVTRGFAPIPRLPSCNLCERPAAQAGRR